MFITSDLDQAVSNPTSLIQSTPDPTPTVQSWESIVERCRRRQPNWRCKTDICWQQWTS